MTFYMISNEMMSNLYMLSSRMMNRALIKTDGTSVITMNGDWGCYLMMIHNHVIDV